MQHVLLGTEDIAINKKKNPSVLRASLLQILKTIRVMSYCDMCYGEKYS